MLINTPNKSVWESGGIISGIFNLSFTYRLVISSTPGPFSTLERAPFA